MVAPFTKSKKTGDVMEALTTMMQRLEAMPRGDPTKVGELWISMTFIVGVTPINLMFLRIGDGDGHHYSGWTWPMIFMVVWYVHGLVVAWSYGFWYFVSCLLVLPSYVYSINAFWKLLIGG
jgi:hypothetical protein